MSDNTQLPLASEASPSRDLPSESPENAVVDDAAVQNVVVEKNMNTASASSSISGSRPAYRQESSRLEVISYWLLQTFGVIIALLFGVIGALSWTDSQQANIFAAQSTSYAQQANSLSQSALAASNISNTLAAAAINAAVLANNMTFIQMCLNMANSSLLGQEAICTGNSISNAVIAIQNYLSGLNDTGAGSYSTIQPNVVTSTTSSTREPSATQKTSTSTANDGFGYGTVPILTTATFLASPSAPTTRDPTFTSFGSSGFLTVTPSTSNPPTSSFSPGASSITIGDSSGPAPIIGGVVGGLMGCFAIAILAITSLRMIQKLGNAKRAAFMAEYVTIE